jgi:hypothetical protein
MHDENLRAEHTLIEGAHKFPLCESRNIVSGKELSMKDSRIGPSSHLTSVSKILDSVRVTSAIPELMILCSGMAERKLSAKPPNPKFYSQELIRASYEKRL